MNVYNATLLNGLVLLVMSLWAYFPEQASKTALIPAYFGLFFIMLSPWVKANNKVIAHLVVVLAVVVLLALIKPFTAALERGSMLSVSRVALMMLTTVVALISYVQSFIAARKAKGSKGAQ